MTLRKLLRFHTPGAITPFTRSQGRECIWKGTNMSVTKHALLGAVACVALGTAAHAQAFNAQNRAADAVSDTESAVQDDFRRDTQRFGNSGRPLGWSGSVSARATATDGNTETSDIGVGARIGHYDGTNGHQLTLSYEFSEADGVEDDNSLLLGYDYTRDLNANLYAFGQVQIANDEFGPYETDAFIGAGLGYRIINNGRTQWSVQGGPGYRFLEDTNGVSTEEFAVSLGSALSHRLTDTAVLTMDTDVLWSELDTLVTNDLGVTVAMSDSLALRTSLLTEWRSDPLPGFTDTDNTLAVSVVYNFN